MSATSWSFFPFRLDPAATCLWRHEQLVALPPKPLAVLAYLVAHAGEVVTKEALLDTVWPEVAVTEGVLKGCIRQIRQALGETADNPRYIATVHRRGYRFIAPVTAEPPPAVVPEPPLAAPFPGEVSVQERPAARRATGMVVGRQAELAQLHHAWQLARQGTRQLVFITGEAGIGKSTLVDTFIAQLQAEAEFWLGHGQSIEHYGAGEAYLPLLEALAQLGRGPQQARVVEMLRQQAPSWLLQLPALLSDADIDRLQRRASGATRERMLRELAEAVEVLAAERAVVLVLEDLHWSDGSTLDWLTYIARRRQAARLLVLGTYRPTEAIVHGHPVHKVTQDLTLHGQGMELVLTYLPEAVVAVYLARRFGEQLFPERLVRVLYQRTNGNSLFLVAVVDMLVRQGGLRKSASGWELASDLEATVVGVPESLRQLIEQQLVQLPPADQELLEAASVAGAEFPTAAVAAVTGDAEEAVEVHCAALTRQGQFLRAHAPTEWPDGTLSGRYGFVHDLYREALYERVPVSRRVRWHGQIGRRLEAGYGPRAREVAAELAEHFLRGRDTERAVQYLQHAGENAQQRSAHQEAIGHLTRGLELLGTLPETPERAQQELTLHLVLGPALCVTRGDAASEVEQTYARAQALCQQHGKNSQSLQVLRGLWSVYNGRLRFRQARDLGEQYLALAQQEGDPVALVEAYCALGTSLFYLGEFTTARWNFEQGMTRYHLQRERFGVSRAREDPGVACLAFLVSTLGFLGHPNQAEQRAEEAWRLAQELDDPYSLAFAWYRAGLHALFYRNVQAAQELAEAVLGVATTHGFPFYEALGIALRGGAQVRQGQGEEGLALLRQGLAALYHTGTQPAPHWLVWQAELYGYVGQPAAGLHLLEEARVQTDTTGNLHALAELYRLKGEFLLAVSAEQAAEAEACFHEALAVARRQQAKIVELRAAMHLARLWQQQGKRDAAHGLLAPIYGWFTEGLDTADLQDAKALLQEVYAPIRWQAT
jgi:DNA-binding winged helix-turn-helix (wHTH) protein/predicted ATPase